MRYIVVPVGAALNRKCRSIDVPHVLGGKVFQMLLNIIESDLLCKAWTDNGNDNGSYGEILDGSVIGYDMRELEFRTLICCCVYCAQMKPGITTPGMMTGQILMTPMVQLVSLLDLGQIVKYSKYKVSVNTESMEIFLLSADPDLCRSTRPEEISNFEVIVKKINNLWQGQKRGEVMKKQKC